MHKLLPDEIYVKITAIDDNLVHNHIISNLRYTLEKTEYLYTSETKHQPKHQ